MPWTREGRVVVSHWLRTHFLETVLEPKKIKTIKTTEQIPEKWQDNRSHPVETVRFVGNGGYILTTYKDTGSMAILNSFSQGSNTIIIYSLDKNALQLIDNPSPIMCKQITFPTIVTMHDNGVLQIYDMAEVTMQRIRDGSMLKRQQQKQKPLALALDSECMSSHGSRKSTCFERNCKAISFRNMLIFLIHFLTFL